MFEWFSGVKFWLIIAVIAFVVFWLVNNFQWREKPLLSFSNPRSSREYIDPSYTRRRPVGRNPPTADLSYTDSSIQELDAADISYIPPPPEELRHLIPEEVLEPQRPQSMRKPNAKQSKGEKLCKEIAERVFGETFHHSIWPDWLRNPVTGNVMELDLYSEKLKIAIEYHGRQHYEYVPHFHRKGPHQLEEQKQRDADKLDICDENGVYVITVPYYVPENRIEQWIRYYEPNAYALREARKEQLFMR